MLINEVKKETGLSKKAINYYIDKGLISPKILENSYRDFDQEMLESLKKIKIYRKLGFSIEEIKKLLANPKASYLRRKSLEKIGEIKNLQAESQILEKLAGGEDIEKISREVESLDLKRNLNDRLLDIFPGYFGNYLLLYFGSFLNFPIENDQQKQTFNQLIDFLDGMDEFNLSEDAKKFLEEGEKLVSIDEINESILEFKKNINNHQEFLENNDEIIRNYIDYTESDEYKNSLAYEIKDFSKKFLQDQGFYEKFIGLMRKLSPDYDNFYKKLLQANEDFCKSYPDFLKENKNKKMD